MKTSTLLAALLLGFAPIPVAQAQDNSADCALRRIETNGDGAISRDEFLAGRARLFARLDGNADGVVDGGELDAARDAIMDIADAAQARLAVSTRRADANGDGIVSEEEFSINTPLFDLVDRNDDDLLSADEIALIRNLLVGPRG